MLVYRPGRPFHSGELLDGLLLLPPLDVAVIHQNSRRRVYSLGTQDRRKPGSRRIRWLVRVVVPSDTSPDVADSIEDILIGNIETVNWDTRSAARAPCHSEMTRPAPAGLG
ncbi:MAG TPA: hypothetical protein VK943_09800 [Arenibaculum sp.]|nr:hypothetical protein [Arenibaculum sp.]